MIDKSKGFVPVWRYLVSEEWEWRRDFKTTFLYIWLTAKANWTVKEWKGRTVLAGQYITSLNHLAEETGLTKSEVRSALNHLCATHYIAHTATKNYSVITIENYEELYTNNTPDSTQTAHEPHTNRTPPALTKPRKQEKPLNHQTKESADKPRRPRSVPPGEPDVQGYFQQQGRTTGEATALQALKEKVPPKRKYGQYGWVRLTDDQHASLEAKLGRAELERCIAYVDESAQATGNKNGWKDWNLVIQKCSRNHWGAGPTGQGAARPAKNVAAAENLAKIYEMFGGDATT